MSAAIAAWVLASGLSVPGLAVETAVPPALRQPKPIWTIDGLSNPESACYDQGTKALYISNVNGDAASKDGNGFITKAELSGKVAKLKWVKGLNAPKGLGACGGKLYAADIDEIVVIDLATAKIDARWPVSGAKFLNDVVVGAECAGFVSDTLLSAVFRFGPAGEIVRWAKSDDLQSPNGLALLDGKLYIASWGLTTDWTTRTPGRLLSIDLKTQQRADVPGPHGNLDGLESFKQGWLVSDWVAGTVMKAAPNGQTKVLIHGVGGAADIGYVPSRDLLLVPRMTENSVSAYKLGELAE